MDGKTRQTSVVTPAIARFLRPVASTAARNASSLQAFTTPARCTRPAKASGCSSASSGIKGPWTRSSWLDVRTTGIPRIFAAFASASVKSRALAPSAFWMSCMVPIWWSMRTSAVSAGVKRSVSAMTALLIGDPRDGSDAGELRLPRSSR